MSHARLHGARKVDVAGVPPSWLTSVFRCRLHGARKIDVAGAARDPRRLLIAVRAGRFALPRSRALERRRSRGFSKLDSGEIRTSPAKNGVLHLPSSHGHRHRWNSRRTTNPRPDTSRATRRGALRLTPTRHSMRGTSPRTTQRHHARRQEGCMRGRRSGWRTDSIPQASRAPGRGPHPAVRARGPDGSPRERRAGPRAPRLTPRRTRRRAPRPRRGRSGRARAARSRPGAR